MILRLNTDYYNGIGEFYYCWMVVNYLKKKKLNKFKRSPCPDFKGSFEWIKTINKQIKTNKLRKTIAKMRKKTNIYDWLHAISWPSSFKLQSTKGRYFDTFSRLLDFWFHIRNQIKCSKWIYAEKKTWMPLEKTECPIKLLSDFISINKNKNNSIPIQCYACHNC